MGTCGYYSLKIEILVYMFTTIEFITIFIHSLRHSKDCSWYSFAFVCNEAGFRKYNSESFVLKANATIDFVICNRLRGNIILLSSSVKLHSDCNCAFDRALRSV